MPTPYSATNTCRVPCVGLRGFTLIELLVVIAIVAVLASLLLGVLSGVRKNAQSAKTLGNLRQSVAGLLLQGGENNGTLILVGHNQNGYTSWLTETERVIGRELGIRDAALNPNHPPYRLAPNAQEPLAVFGVPMASDLEIPTVRIRPALTSSRVAYLSRMERPSDFVLLVDSIREKNPTLNTEQSRSAWDDGEFSMARAGHKGKFHAAMADGSVKLLTPEEYAGHRGRALGLTTYSITYFTEDGKKEQASWSAD